MEYSASPFLTSRETCHGYRCIKYKGHRRSKDIEKDACLHNIDEIETSWAKFVILKIAMNRQTSVPYVAQWTSSVFEVFDNDHQPSQLACASPQICWKQNQNIFSQSLLFEAITAYITSLPIDRKSETVFWIFSCNLITASRCHHKLQNRLRGVDVRSVHAQQRRTGQLQSAYEHFQQTPLFCV